MNEGRQTPRDVISLIATTVPPIYVIFRLVSGGRTTAILYLLLFTVVAFFYWLVILRIEPDFRISADADNQFSSKTVDESEPPKTSRMVVAVVASAYILFLILVAVADILLQIDPGR